MALRSAPHWSRSVLAVGVAPIAIALPRDWNQIKVEASGRAFARLGSLYTPVAVAAVDGVLTLTGLGSPTGGGFKLKFVPQDAVTGKSVTTAQIAYNDSAATVKTKMIAASPAMIATGDVTAAGGALPAAVTLAFLNAGVYGATIPTIEVVEDALTAASGTPHMQLTPTTQPSGNGGYGYIAGPGQEIFDTDGNGNTNRRFLYLAAVAATVDFYVTTYR